MTSANGYTDYDSLAPAEHRFKHGGKEYITREPSEDALIKSEEIKLRGAKIVDGKFTADVGKPLEAQIVLLSMCVVDASDDKFVPLNVIRTWPTRVIRGEYEVAERMGLFAKKETAEEIRARIAADTEKLRKLEGGEDSYAKNS